MASWRRRSGGRLAATWWVFPLGLQRIAAAAGAMEGGEGWDLGGKSAAYLWSERGGVEEWDGDV